MRDRLRPSYRPDIDGLRAISILLVVAFHADIAPLGGGFVGVDVFFVISGFLITGILLAEISAKGTISLGAFYARRARRLLPLSTVVLVSTVLVGLALLAPIDRPRLLGDARAAALYFANWRFARQEAAYGDIRPTESLFVHFWSLSIEEQFCLLWPLLMLLVLRVVGHRGPARLHVALAGVLGGVTVVSFVLGVALLSFAGSSIYYLTQVRIGELGVGAMLALARRHVGALSRARTEVAGIAGLICIAVAASAYTVATPFPGFAVLLPVAGSALVLGSGITHSTGVSRVLGSPPLAALGRVSYGWYLWHWPAIGAALLLAGPEASGSAQATARMIAVVLSLALATATHLLIEEPARHAGFLTTSQSRSVGLGVGLTALSVAATFLPATLFGPSSEESARAFSSRAMTPEQARRDHPRKELGACNNRYDTNTVHSECVFGDRYGQRTAVLVGDSHARHWFPAFDAWARAEGWRLLVWTKAACPFLDVRVFSSKVAAEYTGCATWRQTVLERLSSAGEQVDLVVIGRSRGYVSKHRVLDGNGAQVEPGAIGRQWAEGAARTFAALKPIARKVLIIEDTPWAPFDVPRCLSRTRFTPARCAFPAAKAVDGDRILVQAERDVAPAWVSFADFSKEICPTDPCPAVTPDGIIIYTDRHHMTATFSRTLASALPRVLDPLVDGR